MKFRTKFFNSTINAGWVPGRVTPSMLNLTLCRELIAPAQSYSLETKGQVIQEGKKHKERAFLLDSGSTRNNNFLMLIYFHLLEWRGERKRERKGESERARESKRSRTGSFPKYL